MLPLLEHLSHSIEVLLLSSNCVDAYSSLSKSPTSFRSFHIAGFLRYFLAFFFALFKLQQTQASVSHRKLKVSQSKRIVQSFMQGHLFGGLGILPFVISILLQECIHLEIEYFPVSMICIWIPNLRWVQGGKLFF